MDVMDETFDRPVLMKEAGITFSLGVALYLAVSTLVLTIAGALIGAGASESDLYRYLA